MKCIGAFCAPFCAAPMGLEAFFVPDPHAIDPAYKEWRISHPFPQKTRKWMGHGRSISGPDQ
jgi:hypothetical protein